MSIKITLKTQRKNFLHVLHKQNIKLMTLIGVENIFFSKSLMQEKKVQGNM